MTRPLVLADADTARDVLTFSGRASKAGADGVRLQATGGVLAVTSAALAPQGLFDQTPTILAMRIVHADPELSCDLVVESLTEGPNPDELALPDTALSPAWAGIAPPRGGWEHVADLSAGLIAERALWGISAVAHGSPDDTDLHPLDVAAQRQPARRPECPEVTSNGLASGGPAGARSGA